MEKKFTYFISSTFRDLIEERKAVANYVLKIDEIPIGMEQFGAIDTTQWDHITRLIDTSDYFILIIAGSYGTIDETDPDRLSYTHKEFRYAREKGIPIIGVIHRTPQILSQEFSERDPERIQKLAAFRTEVSTSRLVAYYTDRAELQVEIAASITKGKSYFVRPGWVRSDKLPPGEASTAIATAKALSLHYQEQSKQLHKKIADRDADIESAREELNSAKKQIADLKTRQIDPKFMFTEIERITTLFNGYEFPVRTLRLGYEFPAFVYISSKRLFVVVARRINDGTLRRLQGNTTAIYDKITEDILYSEYPEHQCQPEFLRGDDENMYHLVFREFTSAGLIKLENEVISLTAFGMRVFRFLV